MNTSLRSLARLGALASIVYGQSLFGQALYDLGTLGGTYSYGLSVNDSGQVVGVANLANGDRHPFLYTGGSIQDLTAAGSFSSANSINSSGQVVGYSGTPSFQTAFLYSGGVMTNLGTLGGIYGSEGDGINDLGQVTGASSTANGLTHAFVYSNGVMTDIGALGGTESIGKAINNIGQVTGSSTLDGSTQIHAILYSSGTMSDLGTLGGAVCEGKAINDSGQVAGLSYTATGAIHGFLYSGGTMIDIGTLGGAASIVGGINDSSVVVGYSSTTGNQDSHAFEYSNGVMTDLDTLYSNLLSDGSSAGFIELSEADAISNNGLITGTGLYYDGNGDIETTRAYLLDTRTNAAVPDAANTVGLLALALTGLGVLRRRFVK